MEVVIESIVSGEERDCSDTQDVYFSEDSEYGNKLLVFVPKEIQIIKDDEYVIVYKTGDFYRETYIDVKNEEDAINKFKETVGDYEVQSYELAED
ncbi:hypothetical protein [uncultured Clostridium sp.]|uniref:hypothetical protein n=1 Tax=uncultured Clostridium sp. TaxID=59620 RepID=UPI0028EB364E|nr:hypothetical protein [uncultured Clostridium sp.]